MNYLKIYFTIITFFFTIIFSFSQTDIVIKGSVSDTQNNAPLSYVNIGVLDTEFGTISSIDGNFELYLDEKISSESIVRFSHLGYENQDVTIAQLLKKETIAIRLKEDAFNLAVVEVRPEPTRFKTVGTNRTNSKMYNHFAINRQPNQNLGASVGRRFNIGKENAYLEKFNFYIAANNFDKIRFRINIFSIKNGRPDKNLNTKDLIFTVKDKATGWAEVDLKSQNIRLEEDVIVALEWIYHSENGKILSLPMNVPATATHFYKFGSQDKWKRFRGMSTAMELIYSY